MRRSLLTLACTTAVLLLLPAAAQAITFNQAVDKLFRQGYPQRLEKTIAGFKSTPLGFRWTGSPADNQAAQFLADEMTAAGLTNVKLEPVPVDAWTIESASVTVGGKVMKASSYPGVPPTAADGVDRPGRPHPSQRHRGRLRQGRRPHRQDRPDRLRLERLVVQLPLRRGRPPRRQGRHPHLRQALPRVSGRAERFRVQRPRLHLHVAAAGVAPERLGCVAPEPAEEGAGDGDRDAALQPHARRGRRRGLQRDRRAAGHERRRHEDRLRRPSRLALHRRP